MLLQLVEPTNSPQSDRKTVAIGIDLGTTNSVVAYSKNQNPRIIPVDEGKNLLPSVVSYLFEAVHVGGSALGHLHHSPNKVATSVKRLMGKSISPVVFSKTPIDVSADILKALKKQAERDLGEVITKAVITVPAYFDEQARLATKKAAQLAELEVLRLINEPTAAALAYGLDRGIEGIYVIYDLGGGTFDVSLLRLTQGVFQVLATGGDTQLGGDDIDHQLAQFLSFQSFPSKQGCFQARKIKEHLSTHFQWFNEGVTVTQEQLNVIATPFIDRTLSICHQVLQDANLSISDVKGIVLVGGSTRMPLVYKKVSEFFGQLPLIDLDPEGVVALGAALQAESLVHGSQNLLLDVTPLSLGIETMGGLVEKIIPRNTPIPAAIAQEFTTYQDGQTSMKIHILQGEREFVDHCRSLGSFVLTGIPPMVAGAARIQVTFMIDADGLLVVSAEEKTTGVQQHIEVNPVRDLSDDELTRILLESLRQGESDIQQRLLVETKIDVHQFIEILQKAINSDSALLNEEEKNNLEDRVKKLESVLATNDKDLIHKAFEDMKKKSQFFAERRLNRSIQQALTGKDIKNM